MFIYSVYICVHVDMVMHAAICVWRSEDSQGNRFSPSTIWVLGIKLKISYNLII